MAAAKQLVKVEGLQELDKALVELRESMNLSRATTKNVFKRAMTKAGKQVEDSAKTLVPKRTGALAKSIHIGTQLSRRQKQNYTKESELEIFIGATALPHAHLVEFGSIHNAPQPYFRPAWDSKKMSVLSDLKTFLWSEIEKTAERVRRKGLKAK